MTGSTSHRAGAQRHVAAHRRKILRKRLDRPNRDDAAFFARFPDRCYRMRAASGAEVSTHVAAYKIPSKTPQGFLYSTLVQKRQSDNLDYLFVVGTADPAIDRTEDHVRVVWEDFAHRNFLCLNLAVFGEPCGSLATSFLEETTVTSVDKFVAAIGWPPPAVVAHGGAVHVVWRYSDLQCPHKDWDKKAEELLQLAFVFGLTVAGPASNMPPFDLDSLLAEATS